MFTERDSEGGEIEKGEVLAWERREETIRCRDGGTQLTTVSLLSPSST